MSNSFTIEQHNAREASTGQLSDSEGSNAALESKQPGDIEGEGKKKGFFARPWSRGKIGIFSALLFVGLGLVAIVIALPIIFTRKKHPDQGDTYHLYHSNHDDPSYKIKENRPVFAIHNFPDPGLLEHNGTWYAYGTNPKKHDPNAIHIPVATSTNFVNWTLHHDYDAMPTLGGWERSVNHWAPDVIQRVCGINPRNHGSDTGLTICTGRWKVRDLLRRSDKRFQNTPLHRSRCIKRHRPAWSIHTSQRIPRLPTQIRRRNRPITLQRQRRNLIRRIQSRREQRRQRRILR